MNMFHFKGEVGSTSGFQHTQTLPYNGQPLNQPLSCPPPWSAGQRVQPGMAMQGSVTGNLASTASHEVCYNCGGADHWAQNCPEPRRAIPA
jgi:Zinc knuckle